MSSFRILLNRLTASCVDTLFPRRQRFSIKNTFHTTDNHFKSTFFKNTSRLILLHRWQNFKSPPRLLCFAIQSTAPLLLISPALLTQPKLGGAGDARHHVDDRIKAEGDGGWMRKRRQKNGESDRMRRERPGREEKPCLLCLDISLRLSSEDEHLGINVPHRWWSGRGGRGGGLVWRALVITESAYNLIWGWCN